MPCRTADLHLGGGDGFATFDGVVFAGHDGGEQCHAAGLLHRQDQFRQLPPHQRHVEKPPAEGDAVARDGQAGFLLDLLPDVPAEKVLAAVRHPRGARSLSSHLKSRLRLDGIKSALLHELLPPAVFEDAAALAAAIKALPIRLSAPRPLDEAISSAGGVRLEALSPQLMGPLPGVFFAGEMLDWEAPTGGYLLHACLASGRQAGAGAAAYVA